jgi:peptidoglycan lytic transglycosylase
MAMPPRGVAWLLPVALVALGACARSVVVAPPPPRPGETGRPPARPGDEQLGLASWYGPPHHGRRTASGEIYDMYDLTAAHRTLPFGTRVLAVNRDTDGSVEVRINDRGPFVEGRIIDLSQAAARAIGGIGPGVIPVLVRVISVPDSAGAALPPSSTSGLAYAVQVGSFTDRSRAASLRDAIERELGLSGVAVNEGVLGGETVYRVRIGSYPDPEAARAAARRLAERGYRGIIVER